MFDIPFVFPQTMDEIQREILRTNHRDFMTTLVDDKNLCAQLCTHLVRNGVFTGSVMNELKVC